jgi:acetyl esterase/lipase
VWSSRVAPRTSAPRQTRCHVINTSPVSPHRGLPLRLHTSCDSCKPRAMAMFATQPFKGLYALGAFGFEVVRFPIFLVQYLTSYGRQHHTWTLRQAISVRVLSSALYHVATVQVHTPLPLTPDGEKERFVIIKPAKADVYQGPLRGNEDVVPVDIGATWYPAPLTAGSDRSNIKVILHIHGGAFVTGDGRTAASGYMTKKLLKHSSATHMLCPQYRLSTLPPSNTSNPFPAALQDTLTSYLYLLNELNISAKDIVLSGDSAGGNLAIALLRYIADYGSNLDLPTPSAGLLWSPWINPADTSGSYVHTDYLSPPFTSWGTGAYAGQAGEKALSSSYISQKNRTFKTEVPLWTNTGSGEVLYFDVVEWAEKFKEAGNDITLDIEEHVPHDILLVGNVLGFDKEADSMAKRAGEWLKEHVN